MNWIHRLIELKYTEKTLKKDISEAQKFVVDEAIYFKEMVDEFTKKVQENQASLKQRIDEMVANDKEGSSLSQLIQIEKDQMITGEVKPQVAVSLPKI